jgi:hypothetical protein
MSAAAAEPITNQADTTVVNKAEAAFIPVLRMVLLARVTIIHF